MKTLKASLLMTVLLLTTNLFAAEIITNGKESCTVREDATLVCWASNNAKEIVSARNALYPNKPEMEIIADRNGACTVLPDASLKCWKHTAESYNLIAQE